MDPVLSGSLCFLVLAVVLYVKFIREYPWRDDELHDHKTSPVEPDAVPFLHPSSPVGVLQKQKQSKQQMQQTQQTQKQQLTTAHHGLAALQKARMQSTAGAVAQHYPGFLNKQPMRRRTHSATVNSNVAVVGPQIGAAGVVAADESGDIGGALDQLPKTIFEDQQGRRHAHRNTHHHHHPHLHQRYPPSSGRGQHRINFDNIDFDSDNDMEFLSPSRRGSNAAADDSLESVPFEDHDSGFLDLESSVSPPAMDDDLDDAYRVRSPTGRKSIGDDESLMQFRGSDLALESKTPSKLDAKSTIERQFVRTVAQPAQMQLEVARKARIPLFLHSPMYVKTSTPPIVDDHLMMPASPPRLDHFGGAELPDGIANDGGYGAPAPPAGALMEGACGGAGGGMTPRRRDKLPAKCKTDNSSLHIDFSELKVAELIGQGAFGTVHRASWRGTTVAVKILVCQYLTADILEEFETEVQIMSILRCDSRIAMLLLCTAAAAAAVLCWYAHGLCAVALQTSKHLLVDGSVSGSAHALSRDRVPPARLSVECVAARQRH